MARELVGRWRWPRRRARLPGRGRLRELVADPAGTLGPATPARLWRRHRTAPDEGLIGLLLVRDEDDVLEAVLASATRWFDRILVLDGTVDPERRRRTDAVLARFPEVVHVQRDEDLPGGPPVTDGARQYLLDEARRRYGVEHWIGILHADEFWDQDPRPLLATCSPVLDPVVRVRLVHTFLHPDDAHLHGAHLHGAHLHGAHRGGADPDDAGPGGGPRGRVRHLMWPGVPESRLFFDRGDRDFDPTLHGKVVPRSFRAGPLVDGFCLTQYNERSPDQVRERAGQRMASGWQTGHYARLGDPGASPFTATLDLPDRPFAPEFAGDPEGPFRVRVDDEVVLGPRPDWPGPVLVSQPSDPVPPGVEVDVSHALAPGGLVDLVDRPGRLAVARWSLWMRDPRPGGGLAAVVGARPDGSGGPPDGYLASVRYTSQVLASPRASRRHRLVVAGELLHRLHGHPDGWWARVAPDDVRRLAPVLESGRVPLRLPRS